MSQILHYGWPLAQQVQKEGATVVVGVSCKKTFPNFSHNKVVHKSFIL